MNKEISFNERLLNDYEKYCLENKVPYSKHSAKSNYLRAFNSKLIKNNELDYIVKYFSDALDYDFNKNVELFNYLNKNMDKIEVNELNNMYLAIIKRISHNNHNKEEYLNAELEFFNKLTQSINKTLFDLRKLDYGAYSKIYQIDNILIKIGYRECKQIIDNKRIFYPYFKGNIGNDYIEITSFIKKSNDITYEDVKKVYNELRDQGILWLDARETNLRRITKEDLKIYNENKLNRFKNDIVRNNYHDSSLDEPLQENDLVIIDLDHILDERDSDKIEKIMWNLDEDLKSRLKLLENEYLFSKQNNRSIKK